MPVKIINKESFYFTLSNLNVDICKQWHIQLR